MNIYLNAFKSKSLIISSLVVLMTVIVFMLSGCQPTPAPAPTFNPDSVKAHVIPIAQAIRWTGRFRARVDSLRKNCKEFSDSLWLPRAEAFNSDLIGLLLSQ